MKTKPWLTALTYWFHVHIASLHGGRGPAARDLGRGVTGRGLLSFPLQLNMSSSVYCITNLTHECVVELLNLSSTVNECTPLVAAATGRAVQVDPIKPKLKPPGKKRLKVKCELLL
jgi:hypothetical protein